VSATSAEPAQVLIDAVPLKGPTAVGTAATPNEQAWPGARVVFEQPSLTTENGLGRVMPAIGSGAELPLWIVMDWIDVWLPIDALPRLALVLLGSSS
jgi:hypothetical protein